MNSNQEIVEQARSNGVYPQALVPLHFDMDYLKQCVRDADNEFERHQKKRYIRSSVRNRKGELLPAIYWQTILRIVMAVKVGGNWRMLVCRYG